MPPSTQKLDIQSILPLEFRLSSSRHLASLWSNYGSIYRLDLEPTAEGKNVKSLILKHIRPPPSSGGDESHLRKLISYRVERNFYAKLSPELSENSPVAKSYQSNPEFGRADEVLLLEDLKINYPNSASYSLGEKHTYTVLRWLANFHATFWGHPSLSTASKLIPPPLKVQNADSVTGVWAHGGYWYLDTRLSEFASIQDDDPDSEYSYILKYANYVAEKLSDPSSPGRTFLHGDAKGANIVFNKDGSKCAFYDFQYFGAGLGVQDLAYFLGTAVDGRLLGKSEERLLKYYFEELKEALRRLGKGDCGEYTWEIFWEQWEWALVDWMRFMASWGCWGNSSWIERRVKKIVERWEEEGM
ncbi:hypothetical protein RUND412_002252 [Rhizina undulata]